MLHRVCCGLLLFSTAPLWSQGQSSTPVPAVTGVESSDERMTAPPPVSGQEYPVQFTSETLENYLRGGVMFSSAYSDNVVTSPAGNPEGDASFSVWPRIAIDQTRPRLHWSLSYAPGFTFYRRYDSYDEADQNLALTLHYELTPHVTLSLSDAFQKSSSAFNSPDQSPLGAVSGSALGSGTIVVAPIADRINNTGNVGITYQFAANTMVGVSGTFANLHYPNPSEVTPPAATQTGSSVLFGLYDSSSRGGTAFYSARFSKQNYLGVGYQYYDLFSYPPGLTTDTQTQTLLAFYTFQMTSFSVSFFGGPQHSRTTQITQPSSDSWSPASGASLNWRARRSALALSYARSITAGGGLIGAGRSDTVSASARQRVTKNLTAVVEAGYADRNSILLFDLPAMNGHSISGDVSVERRVGAHFAMKAGYARLYQHYDEESAIAPNIGREWVSISYEFARPLGR